MSDIIIIIKTTILVSWFNSLHVFFQDTNGLVFHGLPAALGVSVSHNFEGMTIIIACFQENVECL